VGAGNDRANLRLIRDVRSKRERELRRVRDAASHRGTGNIGHPKTVSARSDDAIRTRLAR